MFGFRKEPHKHFKNNFLKSVIFQIGFENREMLNSDIEIIEDIFKKDFPKVKSIPQTKININVSNKNKIDQSEQDLGVYFEMYSLDNQKNITIDNNYITYTLGADVYKNYEEIKDSINNMIKLLERLSIKQIKRVAIRKLNLVEFEIKGLATEMLGLVLNPSLISNITLIPSQNFIRNSIHSITLKNDENFGLNMRYGLTTPLKREDNTGQIILDIDVYKVDAISISDVLTIFDDINSEIFNIFNWAISEEIKMLLDE